MLAFLPLITSCKMSHLMYVKTIFFRNQKELPAIVKCNFTEQWKDTPHTPWKSRVMKICTIKAICHLKNETLYFLQKTLLKKQHQPFECPVSGCTTTRTYRSSPNCRRTSSMPSSSESNDRFLTDTEKKRIQRAAQRLCVINSKS